MLGYTTFDLALIKIHISDCCQFSDIPISQDSVATYLRFGGYLNMSSLQIHHQVCQRNNFENQ